MNPDNLSDEDIRVLADMLYERLPAAWQDALVDIEAGKSVETVLKEMSNGHTMRILRRLGMRDVVEQWMSEFRSFVENEPPPKRLPVSPSNGCSPQA